jgi:hypothetical protein
VDRHLTPATEAQDYTEIECLFKLLQDTLTLPDSLACNATLYRRRTGQGTSR